MDAANAVALDDVESSPGSNSPVAADSHSGSPPPSIAPGAEQPADADAADGVRHRKNQEIYLQLPVHKIARIMRKIVPNRAVIAADAKRAVQECVTEFITYITTEANHRCHRDKRRILTAEDVISAMRGLGFDQYSEHLTHYLQRYRDSEGDCRGVFGSVIMNMPHLAPPYNAPPLQVVPPPPQATVDDAALGLQDEQLPLGDLVDYASSLGPESTDQFDDPFDLFADSPLSF